MAFRNAYIGPALVFWVLFQGQLYYCTGYVGVAGTPSSLAFAPGWMFPVEQVEPGGSSGALSQAG